MLKLLILFLALGAIAHTEEIHPSQETSSSEEVEETTISPPKETPPPEESGNEKRDYFINHVHSLASNISKNLVIHDNKVVYSPFALVNALSQISGDDPVLLEGFANAGAYLQNPNNTLNTTLISLGYTKNQELLSKNYTNLQLFPLGDGQDVNELLQQAFLNITHPHHDHVTNVNATTVDSGSRTDPEQENTEKLNATTETVLLTGLSVDSAWATPFHPRYAKKNKFFANSTHVIKTQFMNNIGFYKYAELPEFDAVAVGLPMKGSPRTYAIFIKPNKPEDLETLNTAFEGLTNFTEIFKRKFKTKRVQVSLPRVDIDSQFPITLSPNISTLHISSLLISYTGLYNNFHHSPYSTPRTKPIKFTRLRRRPDDAKLKLDTPFLFHLYDDQVAGFLLSGLILNPTQTEILSPVRLIHPEIKLAKQASSQKCLHEFQNRRKNSDIYDNLSIRCTTDNKEYGEILAQNQLNFTFKSMKNMVRPFYRNEVDYTNVTMGEAAMTIKYGRFSEFDGKIVKILMENVSLHMIYPNERSGLYKIEEMLERTPLTALSCQMREMNVRLKFPEIEVNDFKVSFEKVSGKNKADIVPIERREARKGSSTKRHRQVTIDRGFVYILMEHTTKGIIEIGRIINPQKNSST